MPSLYKLYVETAFSGLGGDGIGIALLALLVLVLVLVTAQGPNKERPGPHQQNPELVG